MQQKHNYDILILEDNLDEEDLNIEDKYDDFKDLEKDLNSNNQFKRYYKWKIFYLV